MCSTSAAGSGLAFAYNMGFILVAVALPIFCLIVVSLHPVWEGHIVPSAMSLHNYVKTLFFWSPESIKAATNGIYNSFILAFLGATIAMILSLVVSHMIHRTKGFGARVLDILCVVPIGFPGIVLAMGVLVTYIRTPIYATIWIILLGYITRFFPYGQRNISSVMLAISEELDQSSRMSGASWFTTLRRITIPLLKPGIFAGWVLLFIIFLRELSISIILYTTGTETISVGVYYLANFENEPLTCALVGGADGGAARLRHGVPARCRARGLDGMTAMSAVLQPQRRCMSAAPYLDVQGLVKWFGSDRAVDDVSFSLAKGKFLTLLGPSGCGKTTTLMSIAGLHGIDAGDIRVGGVTYTVAPAGHFRAAGKARHRHGVPELCHLAAYDGGAERRLSAGNP